jgi:hypothetical protein
MRMATSAITDQAAVFDSITGKRKGVAYLTKLAGKSILLLEVSEFAIGSVEVEECWTIARTTAALGHDVECGHATRVVIAEGGRVKLGTNVVNRIGSE